MARKRSASLSKERMRNLVQFKDWTDEQFDEYWEEKVTGVARNSEFESRIQKKLDEFAEDYDIDDLKINDKQTLRALAQAVITLEDLENYSYNLRSEGIDDESIFRLDKISNTMTKIRSDISSMQNDLKITRKVRQEDRGESLADYIKSLQESAKKFLRARQCYIFCDKCNMLLGTIWVHYSEERNNIVQLVCNRELPDGTKCGNKVKVSIKDLIENSRGVNIENVPEFFK